MILIQETRNSPNAPQLTGCCRNAVRTYDEALDRLLTMFPGRERHIGTGSVQTQIDNLKRYLDRTCAISFRLDEDGE